MKSSPARSQRIRRILYVLHLWTGLILGLWFVYVGLTGSVLAWLPDMLPGEFQARFPYDTSAGTTIVPPSRVIASLSAAYPRAEPVEVHSFNYPTPMFPYYLTIMPGPKPPDDEHFVLVDPYSAKVYPPALVSDLVLGVVAHSHSGVLFGMEALVTSGILSVFALLMLLSGLWLWWPATRKQLKRHLTFKRGVPIRRLLYDLHNVMGIYLYIILFVTTFTSVMMVANFASDDGVEHAVDAMMGAKEADPKVAVVGERLHTDSLFAIARGVIGDRTISQLQFPVTADAPFKAEYLGNGGGLLTGGELVIDPYTGKVLSLTSDRDGPPGHALMHLASDLHLGTFGGVWSKILYTLAGLMPLGLFITGVWRWWIRRTPRTVTLAPTNHAEEPEEAVSSF